MVLSHVLRQCSFHSYLIRGTCNIDNTVLCQCHLRLGIVPFAQSLEFVQRIWILIAFHVRHGVYSFFHYYSAQELYIQHAWFGESPESSHWLGDHIYHILCSCNSLLHKLSLPELPRKQSTDETGRPPVQSN